MNQPEMQPVKSSMLTHLGFDVESFTLFARYNNGSLFAYPDVSPEQYEQVIGAESVGKAFNQIIRAAGIQGTKLEDAKLSAQMDKSGAAPVLIEQHERIPASKPLTQTAATPSQTTAPPRMTETERLQIPAAPVNFATQEEAVETAIVTAQHFQLSKITSAEQRVSAAQYLVEIERERKARVAYFQPIKQAAHTTWKGICDRENAALAPLVEARTSVERVIVLYDAEEQRVRREQEQRLREEQERQEHERAKKEAEELRLKEAQELETQGRHEEVSEVLSQPIVPVTRPLPAVVLPTQAPATKGVSTRKKFLFRIEDETKIPRAYMTIDESKIRRAVNNLGLDANIAGVAVWEEGALRVNTKNAKGGAK